MKFGLIVFVVVILATLLVAMNKPNQSTNSDNPAQLSSLVLEISNGINNDEAVLLDVRSQVEYDLSHAAPADLFNVEWLKNGDLPNIDKDKTVYVYCRSGNRSATAKQILEQNGYSKVIDLGAFTNWSDGGGETEQSQLPPYQEILANIGANPIEPLGNPDAELTMVKYSDFQCPFCARYSIETEPTIRQAYVDSGKIRYEFRNVAYLGDESALAAVAGYCANEYQQFWPFHDQLNIEYSNLGETAFTANNLTNLAATFGIDQAEFSSCLNSGKYDPVVSSETIEAQSQGLSSTPIFLIGDQVVNGALPYAAFQSTIEAEL